MAHAELIDTAADLRAMAAGVEIQRKEIERLRNEVERERLRAEEFSSVEIVSLRARCERYEAACKAWTKACDTLYTYVDERYEVAADSAADVALALIAEAREGSVDNAGRGIDK